MDAADEARWTGLENGRVKREALDERVVNVK